MGHCQFTHRKREVESHQLCVAGVLLGYKESDGRKVLHLHPQSNVGIRQVYLAKVDCQYTRIRGEYLLEDALERTPKAHCLHGV